MGIIPNSKFGKCSQCGEEDVPCVKVGKDLFCRDKCHKQNKVKEQVAKANTRNAVRGLGKKYVPRGTFIELDDKVCKEKWFRLIRTKLTGTCQCGCGNKSQKNDDMYFRHSCCHIFPKAKFHSIKYHPLNYVERAFWGGCHGVMDDTSMDRWVNMADWEDVKAKFYELAPLLTDEERSTKFYSHLEKLVYGN